MVKLNSSTTSIILNNIDPKIEKHEYLCNIYLLLLISLLIMTVLYQEILQISLLFLQIIIKGKFYRSMKIDKIEDLIFFSVI